MSTVLDSTTDEVTSTGQPKAAHIVRSLNGESGVALVMRARVEGFPVEALCGERFIPQRDPKQLPPCETCKEIYEMHRMMNDNLNERPNG